MYLARKSSANSSTRPWATAPLVLYWTALCVGTHLPGSAFSAPLVVSDKVLHFLAYAGLGLLLAALLPLFGARDGRASWGALAIVIVYGAFDELGQVFVPGRTVELADWLANVAGAVTGVTCYQLTRLTISEVVFRPRLQKKPSPP